MIPSVQPALCTLLSDIFSTPCVAICTDAPTHTEYQTTTLLLLESSRYAPVPDLVDLLLHILLNQPPFTHQNPDLWKVHKSRFLAIWTRSQTVATREDAANFDALSPAALSPAACLQILTTMRLEFRNLEDCGFQLVSELLLESLKQLSAEGATKDCNIKDWVHSHSLAVDVLDELLHSVPRADTQDLDLMAEYCGPVWRCLQLLSSGAVWWSTENPTYQDNTVRLARCLFTVPTAAFLFRVALRIDLKPADVHATVTALLEPLERSLGVSGAGKINAFTPSPFTFPVLASLDRHDFTKEYEFASLRVLFASWLASTTAHPSAQNPKQMSAVLQHTEAFKRLKAHPQSAIRVALMYIFNETQQGCKGFKPSTDLKAIELLKVFIAYKNMLACEAPSPVSAHSVQQRPEECVIAHAEWVLPWIWKRRATDADFAMVLTSSWLNTCCLGANLGPEHPVYRLVKQHYDAAFEVFHDLFRHIFNNDFVEKSVEKQATMVQIRRLFQIVIDLTLLLAGEDVPVLTGQYCMPLIRCCVEGLDSEWLPAECWARTVDALAKVPKRTLAEVTKLAQIRDGIALLVPIFLREQEAIAALCEEENDDGLQVGLLKTKVEMLTAQVQFLTLLTSCHDGLCAIIASNSHLIAATVQYVQKLHSNIFLASERPELAWIHSASVASLLELLIVTSFGVLLISTPSHNYNPVLSACMSFETRTLEGGKILQLLLGRAYEMSFITSSLCNLAIMLPPSFWPQHPSTYLELLSYIRHIVLDLETHKWCAFLPSFTAALATLLKCDFPSRASFIHSRWNMALAAKLLQLLAQPVTACDTCQQPLTKDIATLLVLLLRLKPSWMQDLLKTSSLGRFSFLEYDLLETHIKACVEKGELEEAEVMMDMLECWEEWKGRVRVLRRGSRRVGRGADAAVEKGEWRKVILVEGVAGVLVRA